MGKPGSVLVILSGLFSLPAALVQPVAFAVHFEDVDVVGEPVKQGTGDPGKKIKLRAARRLAAAVSRRNRVLSIFSTVHRLTPKCSAACRALMPSR